MRAGASHYVFWWGKSRDTLLLASSIHGMKLLRGTPRIVFKGVREYVIGEVPSKIEILFVEVSNISIKYFHMVLN